MNTNIGNQTSQTQNTINITRDNVFGKCDLKCSYSFKYLQSKLTVKNNNTELSMIYENGNVPPVVYNDKNYNVTRIILVSPSLHLFEGKKAIAELLIEHNPEKGGKPLYVCIPITNSGDSTTATNLLYNIIKISSTRAPKEGDSTVINDANFTLQNIVPSKPFFSYTGNYGQTMCDYIVYGILYAIPLPSDSTNTLAKIIRPFSLQLTGGKLFYNQNGPNATMKRQGIYIDCVPTGPGMQKISTSGTGSETSSKRIGGENVWESQLMYSLITIIGLIVLILVFYLVSYFFNKISNYDKDVSTFSSAFSLFNKK
jgi:carbonic anhydrase